MTQACLQILAIASKPQRKYDYIHTGARKKVTCRENETIAISATVLRPRKRQHKYEWARNRDGPFRRDDRNPIAE